MPDVLLDRPDVLPVVQLRLQIGEARREIQPEPVQAKSALLNRCQTATKEKSPELLKKISPVAWQLFTSRAITCFATTPTQSTWKPF